MLFFNKVAGVGVFPWLLLKFKNAYFVEHPRATPFVLVKPMQFEFMYCVWIMSVCARHEFCFLVLPVLKTTFIWNLIFLIFLFK